MMKLTSLSNPTTVRRQVVFIIPFILKKLLLLVLLHTAVHNNDERGRREVLACALLILTNTALCTSASAVGSSDIRRDGQRHRTQLGERQVLRTNDVSSNNTS